MLKIEFKGDGLEMMVKAVESLADERKAGKIYAIGLNRAAKKTHTIVKRTVAKQMGVTQAAVVKHGGLRVSNAHAGKLIATIDASGKFLPVKDFKPRQGKAGVSASPWGKRTMFPGTWIDSGRRANSGIGPSTKAAAGGQVFTRTDKFNRKSGRNNAIKALSGPAVPVELVRRETAKAFEEVANKELLVETERALKALTKGFIK